MSTDEYVPDKTDWTYDAEAGGGYLRLRNGKVRGCEVVGEFGVVDFGQDDETLGIEVLLSTDAALIDAWLARVRRDAAREALDGLYEDASQDYRIGLQGDDQERMDAAEAVLRATYAWMDHYPEESP